MSYSPNDLASVLSRKKEEPDNKAYCEDGLKEPVGSCYHCPDPQNCLKIASETFPSLTIRK